MVPNVLASQSGFARMAHDASAFPLVAVLENRSVLVVDGVSRANGPCFPSGIDIQTRPIPLATSLGLGVQTRADIAPQRVGVETASDVARRHLEFASMHHGPRRRSNGKDTD